MKTKNRIMNFLKCIAIIPLVAIVFRTLFVQSCTVKQEASSVRKKKAWVREIWCHDVDSDVIANWKSMSSREKVLAIEKYFDFNTDLDTITYSWEENASILFDNSFIEWSH